MTASAGALGTANNFSTLSRGFGAIGSNPANLGLPGARHFTLGLLSTRVQAGLEPVTLDDIDEFEGRNIPATIKEDWLRTIEREGPLTGIGAAEVAPFAITFGRWGFQLSGRGFARTDLNDDTAELLLFGNAGRTGEPRDFDLDGSSFETSVTSTAAISYAHPFNLRIGDWSPDHFSIGATGTLTFGHFLLVGKDIGSVLVSDPAEVEIRFPLVQTDTARSRFNNGSGIGLDLGAAWQDGRWGGSVAIQNVFNSYEWEIGDLFFRKGDAFFNLDDSDSDFDPLPISEAPEELLAVVKRLDFDPRIALGASYAPQEDLTLAAEVRHRFGTDLSGEPRNHVGVAGQYHAVSFLTVQAGASAITDGVQLGAGLAVHLGNFHLSLAGLIQDGDVGDAEMGVFALSLGGI